MRALVDEQLEGLQQPVRAAVDAAAHIQQAHTQRMKHSKLWESVGLRRAYAPQGD